VLVADLLNAELETTFSDLGGPDAMSQAWQ
jgi:hypothetical protein